MVVLHDTFIKGTFTKVVVLSRLLTSFFQLQINLTETIFLPLVDIYLLKVNNRNTRTRFEICSKLTIKTKVLYHKRFLKICNKFTGEHPRGNVISNVLQWRTHFLKNTSRRLLLRIFQASKNYLHALRNFFLERYSSGKPNIIWFWKIQDVMC